MTGNVIQVRSLYKSFHDGTTEMNGSAILYVIIYNRTSFKIGLEDYRILFPFAQCMCYFTFSF